MLLAYSRIKTLVPEFNRRTFTRQNIFALVLKFNCEIFERIQRKAGYYVLDKDGDAILIDSRVSGIFWFEVAFHEIVHLLIHYPCDFLHSKQHFEAENLALVFLIPRRKLLEYQITPFDEIDPRLIPYLIRRQRIFEVYKI